MIHAGSFSTKLPQQIDNDVLYIDSRNLVNEYHCFTDVKFCEICDEIIDSIGQLNYVPPKELGHPQNALQQK